MSAADYGKETDKAKAAAYAGSMKVAQLAPVHAGLMFEAAGSEDVLGSLN